MVYCEATLAGAHQQVRLCYVVPPTVVPDMGDGHLPRHDLFHIHIGLCLGGIGRGGGGGGQAATCRARPHVQGPPVDGGGGGETLGRVVVQCAPAYLQEV